MNGTHIENHFSSFLHEFFFSSFWRVKCVVFCSFVLLWFGLRGLYMCRWLSFYYYGRRYVKANIVIPLIHKIIKNTKRIRCKYKRTIRRINTLYKSSLQLFPVQRNRFFIKMFPRTNFRYIYIRKNRKTKHKVQCFWFVI